MIKTIGVMGILLIGSFFDIKERKIPGSLLLVGGLAAAVLFLLRIFETRAETAFSEGAFSLLPGAGMLLLSFVSGEKVGRGDGCLLLVLGGFEGAETVWPTLGIGLFLQSVFAVGLLVAKKGGQADLYSFCAVFIGGAYSLFVCVGGENE